MESSPENKLEPHGPALEETHRHPYFLALAGLHGCRREGSRLLRFSGSEVPWGPSTSGRTASGKEARVPREAGTPPPASFRMSKSSLGGSGGGAGGAFPVPAVQESRLRAGARVLAASGGVPWAGSRATPEDVSDAAQQRLLDKQGTYKLLTFFCPADP